MNDLVEFLLARITEEESDARANRGTYPSAAMLGDGYLALHVQYGGNAVIVRYPHPVEGYDDVNALTRWTTPKTEGWTSSRVLADCEAKRRIVGWYAQYANEPQWTEGPIRPLMELAAVYADHPGYRSEWRP